MPGEEPQHKACLLLPFKWASTLSRPFSLNCCLMLKVPEPADLGLPNGFYT